MYSILITDLAERDILEAYLWWRDNRSADEAARWLDGIYPAIETLKLMPERCPRTSEEEVAGVLTRQLLFGIGRRKTHRIVFAIEGNQVVILRVRHVAQLT